MSRLAFDVVNIIEKLPVKVESLAVYQERLVVGTSQVSPLLPLAPLWSLIRGC